MPNWGGPSQLFSNQARLSSNSTPDIPEAEERSEEGESEDDSDENGEEEDEEEENGEGQDSDRRGPVRPAPESDEGEQADGPAPPNGKGRAVTMEEVSSSDDDSDE